MAPRLKQDYPALMAEYNQRMAAGETPQAIKATFQERGIHWGTFQNYRTKAKNPQPSQRQETPMSVDEAPVEVLEGQMEIEDADTPAPEVHYDAVNEFLALPEGYEKVIQPMREYTEAEDEALKESVRLFGFIGTIVRDQYGRVLDGNQRQRVARWFGKGCPFTITRVRDDAHAIEIANQLNLARRHFTPEQRQQIAASLRDQGRSYRYIADALHVSHTQARADVREAEVKLETDFPKTTVNTESLETDFPISAPVNDSALETHFPNERAPEPEKRIQRKGGGSYPAKRPNGTKPTTSPADRQLAQVINLLMSHAQQWNDQHWQAFLEVVQNLRGGREVPATE